MDLSFEITVDVASRLVRLKVGGLFTLDDVQAFAAEQRAAYAKLGTARGRHRTLCDVSECKIQLQEVFAAFRQLLDDPWLMSERMAFVTGRSPAKMQVRRLISRDTCRFFDGVREAEQWLREQQAVQAPARVQAAEARF
ncbi:MAG TPA: hypothetical protein VF637_16980 [Sphingomicrobium sp.]